MSCSIQLFTDEEEFFVQFSSRWSFWRKPANFPKVYRKLRTKFIIIGIYRGVSVRIFKKKSKTRQVSWLLMPFPTLIQILSFRVCLFIFLFSLANKHSLSKIGSDERAKVSLSIKLVCGIFSLFTWAIIIRNNVFGMLCIPLWSGFVCFDWLEDFSICHMRSGKHREHCNSIMIKINKSLWTWLPFENWISGDKTYETKPTLSISNLL